MTMHRPRTPFTIAIFFALVSAGISACSAGDPSLDGPDTVDSTESPLSQPVRQRRYERIRDKAAARGLSRTGYLLAGIANDETGLAQCWSEATWACQGPASPDCGGGPVIAGSADGPCSAQQGGLGMFQFDAGTFSQTLAVYGRDVLTIEGQVDRAVDYVVRMVRDSIYTTNAETDAKALAWLASFDVRNPTLRDQWIKTVVQYYNGCQPGWSCWSARYATYSDGLTRAVDEPGGLGFWGTTPGTRCNGGAGLVQGEIDALYRRLGGCGSALLGLPRSDERRTPDGRGRYSVFDRGSIYWTSATGAHEVLGRIRDRWAELGWEAGVLGYPISGEQVTPDKSGRFSVFERGSIYWTEKTDAHEVMGRIRDAWARSGWEVGPLGYPTSGEIAAADGVGKLGRFQNGIVAWSPRTDAFEVHGKIRDAWVTAGAETGALGYPISDEYPVPGGKKNDFEKGAIVWTSSDDRATVSLKR